MIEPVLGEGGFVVAPPNYLKRLQEVCRKYGILFIADEVQTGFCRTGEMFACTNYGLEPDLIVMAKSLAAGFPLSAVTGRSEIMDSAQIGGLGSQFPVLRTERRFWREGHDERSQCKAISVHRRN